jgi:Cyclin, C-terminal domain
MERYARIAQVNERVQMLAQYLCDTCLLDCTLMKEKPSKLAAVCLYSALYKTRAPSGGSRGEALLWNATLTKNSGYKEEEVRGMAMDLIKFVKNVEQSSL